MALIPKGELEERLGKLFQDVRRERRVWLGALAEAIGCSINTIRWHENGVRMMRSDLIVKAAEHMGVEPGYLLDLNKDEPLRFVQKRKDETSNG